MTRTLALAALLALAAAPAAAGESACWFENGVLVVPAEVMGVSGDYILDTASPHTLLADSQAQTAGFAETALTGTVRLARLTLRRQPVTVANLDLRTGALPTPIAGVIGADVLAGRVLDVRFAPCRVALRQARRAGRFRAEAALSITWIAGRPTVHAAVTDGLNASASAFAPATGADTALRISDAKFQAMGVRASKELYPGGVARRPMRALSFAGALFENLPAGLVAAEDPGLAGEIGAPVLARFRLRFDFPHGRLLLRAAR